MPQIKRSIRPTKPAAVSVPSARVAAAVAKTKAAVILKLNAPKPAEPLTSIPKASVSRAFVSKATAQKPTNGQIRINAIPLRKAISDRRWCSQNRRWCSQKLRWCSQNLRWCSQDSYHCKNSPDKNFGPPHYSSS